jgi:hypothetical protein
MGDNMTIWGVGSGIVSMLIPTMGGKPAVRAVAIFTTDKTKLNEDVTDKFALCESAISSSSSS